MPVESLFPQGRQRIELAPSGWSRVLGIDAVGGPPHCDFANEGCARVSFRRSPGWRGVTLAGVVLDLVGEVGDKSGSLCQIAGPDGIGMERCWNARKPGQRTWVDWRECCETPVEDGGHIVCGSKVASGGGRHQVAEWMFTGFGRDGEQVGSQGWPGRLVLSPGMYWSAWSSSAMVWGPRSCSAATWRLSV